MYQTGGKIFMIRFENGLKMVSIFWTVPLLLQYCSNIVSCFYQSIASVERRNKHERVYGLESYCEASLKQLQSVLKALRMGLPGNCRGAP